MKIDQIIKKGLAVKKSLPQDSKHSLIKKDNNFEVSVYSGELTIDCLGKSFKKIKDSYPTLPTGFYEVFGERIKDNSFSDKRLMDSVNHVIDNCVYPQPTIAQFLSYDKRIEVFNRDQMLIMNDKDKGVFQRLVMVRLTGVSVPMWTSKANVEMYNLELFKK